MEDDIYNKSDLIQKILNIVRSQRKLLIIISFILIVILSIILFLNYYQNSKNEKISEKYIKASIYLSANNKEKSKLIYKEIVNSKNKFYSILALNNLIENDLEKNREEILKLFEIIENINVTKEQKNLVKLKKALYLKKISKDKEGNELLKEIISENSIWKEAAIEISK